VTQNIVAAPRLKAPMHRFVVRLRPTTEVLVSSLAHAC
jgi:hypothetical protein